MRRACPPGRVPQVRFLKLGLTLSLRSSRKRTANPLQYSCFAALKTFSQIEPQPLQKKYIALALLKTCPFVQ